MSAATAQAPDAGAPAARRTEQTGLFARIKRGLSKQRDDATATAGAAVHAADTDGVAHGAEAAVDEATSRSHNIVGAAVTLGLSVIMLILMAIVAGYFVTQAPSDGAFSEAINQVEDVGGTAFILLAVALLAVPVVAIVGYFMRSGLGAFISGGGGMGR